MNQLSVLLMFDHVPDVPAETQMEPGGMRSLEMIKHDYIKIKSGLENDKDPSNFKMGWIAALGYVLGEDCP